MALPTCYGFIQRSCHIIKTRVFFCTHSHLVLLKTPSTKTDMPNLVTCLDGTPIFEWNVVRCESKNMHQKKQRAHIHYRLHAEYMITILGSIVNMVSTIIT